MQQNDADTANSTGVFLTAEWRDLAVLSYEVDPALLRQFIPAGTELNCWNGNIFLSLVGFRFLKTRVLGIPIPFHRNFDQVNLRFYVRRREGSEVRKGVAFIREIAPRWALAAVARATYNEKYAVLPVSHSRKSDGAALGIEYAWRFGGGWSKISLTVSGDPALPVEGSKEHFIAEHYWGYSAQREGGCLEFRVAHPSWPVWAGHNARFEGDVEELYGRDLAAALQSRPVSAFLAEGSAVTVYRGRRL